MSALTVAAPSYRSGARVGPRLPAAVRALRERGLPKRHVGWIGLWSVVGVVGTLAAPALLGHPLLLMALSPRTVFVALAARETDALVFMLVGIARLSVTDPSYFVVGRLVGREGSPTGGRARRLVRWLCGSRPLVGAVLFLRPNAKYVGIAGAQGVPALLVAGAATAGTVAYLLAVRCGVGLL